MSSSAAVLSRRRPTRRESSQHSTVAAAPARPWCSRQAAVTMPSSAARCRSRPASSSWSTTVPRCTRPVTPPTTRSPARRPAGPWPQPAMAASPSSMSPARTPGSWAPRARVAARAPSTAAPTWTLSQTAKTDGNKQNNPRLIEAHSVNGFTVYDVDLINAPLFHVYFEGGNGLTVWGGRIKTPPTARNTDGIDPDSATNVTVNNSYIQDGDDGIAIKTNSGAASNMTIENSHFYGTHGISIGSETQYGVTNILVQNNTVSGVDSSGNVSGDNNGIRIKTTSSEGGTVNKVTYDNTDRKS